MTDRDKQIYADELTALCRKYSARMAYMASGRSAICRSLVVIEATQGGYVADLSVAYDGMAWVPKDVVATHRSRLGL